MAYLDVESGRRIYFEDHHGTGRPLLLVHGWGMSGRVWDTTTAHFVDAGHRVVTFDQRGCGASDKDFRDVSIAAGAADAVAIADALDLSGVVLNGWSLGGPIAAEAAHRLGKRCAGLILTGGATPRYVQAENFPYGGAPGSVAETVAALRANRTPFLHGLARAVCARDPGDGVIDWLWQVFQQTSPAADAALAELDHLDQRSLLAGLDVPLLSIVGSADGFVAPDIGRAAAELAPNGKLAFYEGCGHAPFLEEAERYRADVAAFIDGLAS